MAAKLILLLLSNGIVYLLFLKYLSTKTHTPMAHNCKYFFYGCLSVLPLLAIMQFGLISKYALLTSTGVIYTYYFLATLEEVHKTLPFLHKDEQSFHLTELICVAMGFAFLENILFSFYAESLSQMVTVNITRILLNTSIHIVSTSIGAISYLYIYSTHIMHSMLANKICGVFIGASIHALFNLLQVANLHFLSIPTLVGCIYLLTYSYDIVIHRFMVKREGELSLL